MCAVCAVGYLYATICVQGSALRSDTGYLLDEKNKRLEYKYSQQPTEKSNYIGIRADNSRKRITR